MTQLNLGEFLHRNAEKSNKELAKDIRAAKKLSNKHDNIILYQEKKSLDATVDKLAKSLKSFNNNAQLIILINDKQWIQE